MTVEGGIGKEGVYLVQREEGGKSRGGGISETVAGDFHISKRKGT